MIRPFIPAVLLASLTACASPGDRLEAMFERDSDAVTADGGLGSADEKTASQLARHVREVRAMHEKGEIETAEDHVHAAYIMNFGSSLADLELAEELALRAAELGDDRGWRLAAEAVDRQCVKTLARYQRYGTQYVYEVVLDRYRLYPVDPRTTDVERAAWGVEPMEVLREREAELNAAPQLKIRKPVEEGETPVLTGTE